MAQFLIECIRKDQSGVILQVGIGGYLNDVEKIVNSILGGGQDEYYVLTPDKRYRVKVHARRRPDTGRLYLTTSPDANPITWTHYRSVRIFSNPTHSHDIYD
jgi:hypothetical protein